MLQDVWTTTPKDLAIIELSPQLTNMLENYKQFYQITEPSVKSEDVLISYAGVASKQSDRNTLEGKVYSLGVVMSDYKKYIESDYIVSNVSVVTFGIKNLSEKVISNFQGLSGGGLWKIINQKPHLIGIAIAQDLTGYKEEKKEGQLYFHGPLSISVMLESWRKKFK